MVRRLLTQIAIGVGCDALLWLALRRMLGAAFTGCQLQVAELILVVEVVPPSARGMGELAGGAQVDRRHVGVWQAALRSQISSMLAGRMAIKEQYVGGF